MILDFVAKRYGQLPSTVLAQGSDLDMITGEIALGYENYLHEKANNETKGVPTMGKKYTNEQLAAMLATTRAKK